MPPITPTPTKVSPTYHIRDAAPINVWDWQSYLTWKDQVWSLLSDVIDSNVKDEFLRAPPEYIVGDDLGWLDEIITRATGEIVDIKSLLAERIRNRFGALRSYHCTNAIDLQSFFSKGLLPLDVELAQQKAENIFLNGKYPELTIDHLQNAIDAVPIGSRAERVWFDCNERLLVEECGHYLIYGNEYLVSIAAALEGYKDYRRALKNLGKPTVLMCDVPFSIMDDYVICMFAGLALEQVFQELLDGNEYVPERLRGAGYSIKTVLPSSAIVGYYHPKCIKDPIA